MAFNVLELSLRGQHFDVDLEPLKRDSSSLLSAVARGEVSFPRDNNGRLYINRNAAIFNYILDYYDSGKLSFPAQYTWDLIKEELSFWQLESAALTKECEARYDAEKQLGKRGEEIAQSLNRYDYMSQGAVIPQSARGWRKAYEFVDIPQSSILSMVQ